MGGTYLTIGLVRLLKLWTAMQGVINMDTLQQRFEVERNVLIIERIDCGISISFLSPSRHTRDSHSDFSLFTNSIALPIRTCLTFPSRSTFAFHFFARTSICRSANCPTNGLDSRIPRSHAFCSAVTEDLISARKRGMESMIC